MDDVGFWIPGVSNTSFVHPVGIGWKVHMMDGIMGPMAKWACHVEDGE